MGRKGPEGWGLMEQEGWGLMEKEGWGQEGARGVGAEGAYAALSCQRRGLTIFQCTAGG